MELAGLNVEHVSDHGTVGAYFLKGLDVDATEAAFLGYTTVTDSAPPESVSGQYGYRESVSVRRIRQPGSG